MFEKIKAKFSKKSEAKIPQQKEEKKSMNPLDFMKKGGDAQNPALVQGIVQKETGPAPERLLDAAPEVDLSLLEGLQADRSMLLILLKWLFNILVVVSLGSFLFFTFQLSGKLDGLGDVVGVQSVSRSVAATNAEILDLQTDLNFYRFLEVKAYMDEFSFYGDIYIQNFDISRSTTVSASEKAKAEERLESLRSFLGQSYENAKNSYFATFTAPIFSEEGLNRKALESKFEGELILLLDKKAKEFEGVEDEEARREFKNLEHTKNLVGNDGLKALMVNTDFVALSEEELYEFIKQVNSLIVNDFSIIQEIKEARIKWSDIINEIDLRTIAVDSQYTISNFEQVGGIRYTSYDFNTEDRQISITGESKSFDGETFSLISDLIDSLNSSVLFENAEMRSFSKSGTLQSGYSANLRLTLDLNE